MATIGSLIVNMIARTSAFDKKLKNSQKRVSAFGKAAHRTRGMLKGLGIAMGAGAVIMGAKKLISLWAEQVRAEQMFDAALRATGQNVRKLGARFRAFAAEIQRQTIYGDEFVLGLMAQATNLGITADRLKEATRGAIGLSAALGLDLNAAMRYTALAMQGEYTMLRRYIPALREAKTAAEQFAIMQREMAKGYKIARAAAETPVGKWKQMMASLGDVGEKPAGWAMDFLTAGAKKVREFQFAVAELVYGVKVTYKELENIADLSAGQWAAEQAAAAKQRAKDAMALNDALGKRQAIYRRLRDGLENQILTYGKTASAIAIMRAEQAKATTAEIDHLRALGKQHAEQKEWAKGVEEVRKAGEKYTAMLAQAKARGLQLAESLKGPVQRFKDFRTELESLVAKGALTRELMTKAMAKRFQELAPHIAEAGRMDRGEFRVVKSAFMDIRGLGVNKMMDPAQKKREEQLDEAKKQTRVLETIRDGGGIA